MKALEKLVNEIIEVALNQYYDGSSELEAIRQAIVEEFDEVLAEAIYDKIHQDRLESIMRR